MIQAATMEQASGKLCYSTYFGGTDRDLLEGLAISGKSLVATGLTLSHDLALPGKSLASRPVEVCSSESKRIRSAAEACCYHICGLAQ